MEELKEIGIKIYTAIFNDKSNVEIDGIEYPINKFTRSGVRYVDAFGQPLFRFVNLSDAGIGVFPEGEESSQSIA